MGFARTQQGRLQIAAGQAIVDGRAGCEADSKDGTHDICACIQHHTAHGLVSLVNFFLGYCDSYCRMLEDPFSWIACGVPSVDC